MQRLQAVVALLLLAVTATSCADGGVGGTGISGSATLEGNVQDILAGNGAGATHTSGIWVGVQGTEVVDITDDEGRFILTGPIGGDRVVEFRSGTDAQPSTMNVTVLEGGVTELKDVVIFPGAQRATASQILVKSIGLVLDDNATCDADGGGRFTAHPMAQPSLDVTVVITPATRILRSASAEPLPCSELTAGSVVTVVGEQSTPREIVAERVTRTKSGSRS